jgi:hypothetical protein
MTDERRDWAHFMADLASLVDSNPKEGTNAELERQDPATVPGDMQAVPSEGQLPGEGDARG